jgi:DHA1 family tetracycline resistance protein-like MFS transporter
MRPHKPVAQQQGQAATQPTIATVAPLYAAGFVTAFGAHSIAANLGWDTGGQHTSLLVLGVLLAVYDGAEVLLKPVFGALCDRIGPRRVLLGGLTAFAALSAVFIAADTPALLAAARLGQGAAAAAFSPAASTMLARLAPADRAGRAFGSYGGWKSLGYTTGPLLGSALVTLAGFPALFATLALLAAGVALWAAMAVPATPPLPKARPTVLDLARQAMRREFLLPAICLAGTAATLTVAIGYLPVLGATADLTPIHTGAAVSLLALMTAVIQPWAGRARDAARLPERTGMALGLAAAAAGLVVAALLPALPTLLAGAVITGAGIGVATPLAFAALATHSPAQRLGSIMGTAEIGRELGDAGGPLLVAAAATALTLTGGILTLAALLVAAATVYAIPKHRPGNEEIAG